MQYQKTSWIYQLFFELFENIPIPTLVSTRLMDSTIKTFESENHQTLFHSQDEELSTLLWREEEEEEESGGGASTSHKKTNREKSLKHDLKFKPEYEKNIEKNQPTYLRSSEKQFKVKMGKKLSEERNRLAKSIALAYDLDPNMPKDQFLVSWRQELKAARERVRSKISLWKSESKSTKPQFFR